MVASAKSGPVLLSARNAVPKELKENLSLETIGPERAKFLLSRMGPQRNIRVVKIKQFADDMAEGRWSFNGAPIVLDKSERLRDGQNRMHAIIQSNTEHTFVVLRNASEETIATIDTGVSRTFADVTRMQGIPYAVEMAAACNVWWKYENDAVTKSGVYRPSHKQLEAVRDAHLDALDAACKLVAARKNARTLTPKSALIFVLAYLHEKKPELATQFADTLDTGLNITQDDPMYALRRILITNAGKRSKLDQTVILAYLIKAFNYRYAGRSVQNLMWRSDEAFPKFSI